MELGQKSQQALGWIGGGMVALMVLVALGAPWLAPFDPLKAVARSFGDNVKAQSAFAAARVNAAKTVEEQPEYAPAWEVLGAIDAGLGHKAEAIAEGKRACEILPLSKDAWDGPSLVRNLALIYTWVGEKDLAFEQLAVSAKIPAGITYGDLKLSPIWDSLRGDPRLENIVAALAPKDAKP